MSDIKAKTEVECECGFLLFVPPAPFSASCDECGALWCTDVEGEPLLMRRSDDSATRDLVLSSVRDRLQEAASMMALGGPENQHDLQTQAVVFIGLQLDRLNDALEEIAFGEDVAEADDDDDQEVNHGD